MFCSADFKNKRIYILENKYIYIYTYIVPEGIFHKVRTKPCWF